MTVRTGRRPGSTATDGRERRRERRGAERRLARVALTWLAEPGTRAVHRLVDGTARWPPWICCSTAAARTAGCTRLSPHARRPGTRRRWRRRRWSGRIDWVPGWSRRTTRSGRPRSPAWPRCVCRTSAAGWTARPPRRSASGSAGAGRSARPWTVRWPWWGHGPPPVTGSTSRPSWGTGWPSGTGLSCPVARSASTRPPTGRRLAAGGLDRRCARLRARPSVPDGQRRAVRPDRRDGDCWSASGRRARSRCGRGS